MIRQGNKNKKVHKCRYFTAGTFDAYLWQLLENKQRFIAQFMSHTAADRDVRDISDTVLNYAEIKALSVGDPLLKTRIDTSNDLERAKIHSKQRQQELAKLEDIIKESPTRIAKLEKHKQRLQADMSHFKAHRKKLPRSERYAFGEELLFSLEDNDHKMQDRYFDSLHDFEIFLPAGMRKSKPYIIISGANRYHVDMHDAKEGGCVQRIEHLLSHLDDQIRKTEENIKHTQQQVLQAEAECRKGNPYEAEVIQLKSQLMDIDEELTKRAEAS